MKREKGNRREWIKMLNIAICDDDIQITGTIENLVRKIANKNFVEVETEVFWNGQGLLDAIIKDSKFDIIYLDIEMPKEDGISVAKRIRTYDKNVLIIYVTSHENHMRDSFSVRPFQFLVKPVAEEQMETCFKAVRRDILQALTLEQERFGIEPEITAKLAKAKCRIVEVPIDYAPRCKSSGKKIGFKDGLQAIACIWKYR